MKKILISAILLVASNSVFSQENTLPTTGNIGVGTLNPSARLDVNGNAIIDSSLVIKDSLIVNRSIRTNGKMFIEQKITMKENAQVKQNLRVNGNTRIDGLLKLPSTSFLSNNNINNGSFELLVLNQNGVAKKVDYSALTKSIGQNIYNLPVAPEGPISVCDLSGFDINRWRNGPNKIFSPCPQVFVGIGEDTPLAQLHVNGRSFVTSTSGIGIMPNFDAQLTIQPQTANRIGLNLVLPHAGDNSYGLKIQTENDLTKAFTVSRTDNGLDAFVVYGNGEMWSTGVHVRSINNFPDYVFESNYDLMPLKQLRFYIKNEKHLPNLPSAQTVKENGADLVELNRLLVEKVEELTLYILEQDQKIQELSTDKEEIERLKKDLTEIKRILVNLKGKK